MSQAIGNYTRKSWIRVLAGSIFVMKHVDCLKAVKWILDPRTIFPNVVISLGFVLVRVSKQVVKTSV